MEIEKCFLVFLLRPYGPINTFYFLKLLAVDSDNLSPAALVAIIIIMEFPLFFT